MHDLLFIVIDYKSVPVWVECGSLTRQHVFFLLANVTTRQNGALA